MTRKTLRYDAVILAAGKGTRMKSEIPKVLHRACGWTLLRLVAEAIAGEECRTRYFVVGHGKSEVEAEIHSWSLPAAKFACIYQKQQLGTGDAVRAALAEMRQKDLPILILSGDSPLITAATIQQLFASHMERQARLTVGAMRPNNPFGYGRIVGKNGRLERIVEENEAGAEEKAIPLVNGGIYVVEPDFLQNFLPLLQPSLKSQEYYLTDLVALGHQAQEEIAFVELDAAETQGVNNLEQLADVANDLRRRKCREWMHAGVVVQDPRHTYCDMDVICEAGVVLEPHCYLFGKTHLHAKCHIESGARLVNAEVEANARIRAYSCLDSCVIEANAVVGPMANIRPESRVGAEAKIGNFVELKKTNIGANTKVSHLSYLGDAEVGMDVNIGCGFITCNYDGVMKHKTRIGDRAFVGSDVQAIAPVEIEADSYVASGSTINKRVPSGDLAIARARQENKTGYAKRILAAKKRAKGK